MSIKVINKELKDLLGDELYAQVDEKLATKDVVIEMQKDYIPKERFNEVNKLYKELEPKYNEMVEKLKDYDDIKANVSKFSDYETLKQENEALKTEKVTGEYKRKLENLGVDSDFIDYALSKIEKGEKFEENAKLFIEANPKFKAETFQNLNSNLNLNGKGEPDLQNMTTEEYLAFRSKNPL